LREECVLDDPVAPVLWRPSKFVAVVLEVRQRVVSEWRLLEFALTDDQRLAGCQADDVDLVLTIPPLSCVCDRVFRVERSKCGTAEVFKRVADKVVFTRLSREDGVLFTVPSPVYGGGSVHHYAKDEHRPVVALESGDIVKPTELIPDNCDQR